MGRLGISVLATTAVVLMLCVSGCGADSGAAGLPVKHIYVALPLHGPLGQRGRDMADAAAMALEKTNHDTSDVRLELKVVDTSVATGNRYERGRALAVAESFAKAEKAARRAAADKHAVAMIGGLDEEIVRGESMATIPEGMLQISLARQVSVSEHWSVAQKWTNIVRLVPAPSLQADAVDQASAVDPVSRYVADSPSLVRVPPGRALVTPALHESVLQPSGRRFFENFREAYGRTPDRWAIYAYDAATLAVEAIERAGKSEITRRSVSGAALSIQNRYGAIGHYDILPNGYSTLYLFQVRRLPKRADVAEDPGPVFEAQSENASTVRRTAVG